MPTQTIQAKVNSRLLTKASRLFTGSLAGRIIEILQNARRAGAKQVFIANDQGTVTVRDDGAGIADFATLLDLGGSGWQEELEPSEDPAGVGLFCLSPRPLSIRSAGRSIAIPAEAWTGGRAIPVLDDPRALSGCGDIPAGLGTELSFPDEPWTLPVVAPLARFSGLAVTVDGQACPREHFITGPAAECLELGCRIQALAEGELPREHQAACLGHSLGDNVLVNFHGQVVGFAFHAVSGHRMQYLVELTGAPTGIRLMLPARTCPVENEAFGQLKLALERESFLHLQRQGWHRLPYKEYLRARELGIELPEATPAWRVGLLVGGYGPEPVEVTMPDGHPLHRCYRLGDTPDRQDSDEANVHLLAALGELKEPFVPVEIDRNYEGYSWAKLPMVESVAVKAGKLVQESWVGSGRLRCVEELRIEVRCSDGKRYSSAVCMAVQPPKPGEEAGFMSEENLYVTAEALERLSAEQIWYHMGGWSDEGDTYETQAADFGRQLEAFAQRLLGPHEPLRARLMECLDELKDWSAVTIDKGGKLTIRTKGGREIVAGPRKSGGQRSRRK